MMQDTYHIVVYRQGCKRSRVAGEQAEVSQPPAARQGGARRRDLTHTSKQLQTVQLRYASVVRYLYTHTHTRA